MDTVEKQRIHTLNDQDIGPGNYVLYWMHSAQRVHYNHALTCACGLADRLNLPVIVYFGITEKYPEANLRHFKFLLEGLSEVSDQLKKRKIKMITWLVDPAEGAVNLAENAAAVVTDFPYLKVTEEWVYKTAKEIRVKLFAVESNIIVPVRTASFKEEYSAGTFRPKIMKQVSIFMNKVQEVRVNHTSVDFRFKGVNLGNHDAILKEMNIDRTVRPSDSLRGGTSAAVRLLNSFIRRKLDSYPEKRNYPSLDFTSRLSPYLHFGHISPVFIAHKIFDTNSTGRDIFLDELIVRRELSFNFIYYNKKYDSTESLPDWAEDTLLAHESDRREYVYSKRELENSMTHDPYWNAAQNELVTTGLMHNYMRMYWGKKILEWTESHDTAYSIMVYLNNRYALDGRDPNSYAGIAWCLGKHDRPWGERPVFGKVRYMNDKGLVKKFDMAPYLKKFGREQVQ